jgi:hypothetical protein
VDDQYLRQTIGAGFWTELQVWDAIQFIPGIKIATLGKGSAQYVSEDYFLECWTAIPDNGRNTISHRQMRLFGISLSTSALAAYN